MKVREGLGIRLRLELALGIRLGPRDKAKGLGASDKARG